MYRASAAIQHWLEKSTCDEEVDDIGTPEIASRMPCVSDQTSSKKRTLDMTVPLLSAARSSSPKKPELDSAGGNSDSSYMAIVSLDINLDSTTRPGPVKDTVGLQRLDKPVQFGSLDDNAEEGQLPEDARDLFSKIWTTVNFHQDIYPAEIQDEIVRLNHKISPSSFRRAEHRDPGLGGEGSGEANLGQDAAHDPFFDSLPIWALPLAANHSSIPPTRLARAEFQHARHLVGVARECLALRRSEASWNSKVHEPLLALALWKYRNNVTFENATSARILPAFIPALVIGEAIESKMVDFVLSPNFVADDCAASQTTHSNAIIDTAIQNKLATQPSAGLCNLGINQTDYPPLLRAPAAITVETKIGGTSSEEGRLQLGIWTAAWHIRMAALGWSLYFAADRGHKIEILGTMQIGMTDTVQGIYRLLAVLRLLAEWIETEFRKWVISAFSPGA
ncbi:hypothetical protein MMYC01_202303 [Madurella mycetomatis]|uniref:PD-(D/E)XK nuclease-like domain-containing protein n=1 Tax=Madurella mycetomatis TaxID=100816 RepID=A0A175W921_9PEZI|nr:hypothetical protein MMYC01_202303 [Madurella mycetomatis]